MYNIKTLNKIAQVGMKHFGGNYTCGDNVENPDAIMVRSAAMHDMEFGHELKAIARAGAGTNNIPIDRCNEQGIVVFNTPGANANAVKELVIAAMLLASRKVVDGINWVQTLKGNGENIEKMVEKGKNAYVGPELLGKTLGVVGLGAIGILIANVAEDLGMDVYGYDPFMSVDAAWRLSRKVKHATSIQEIYEHSDYITIHVPFNKDTANTICAESIASMKDGVRIINLARGGLVNTKDMVAALESGKVGAYVTDFPADELIGVQNFIGIPHLGASTPESEDNCAVMAARQVVDFLENGNIRNSVNLPEVILPRTGGMRITVVHKNVPHILSQISSQIASEGLNIGNMVNKSKGEMAYTVCDVDGNVSDAVIDHLKVFNGIIRVTVL